jgi:predicted permease
VSLLPIVESASVATTAPFWSSTSTELHVPGLDSIPTSSDGGPYFNAVTPQFFATMGTAIVRGRGFLPTDDSSSGRVAVVSETMARIIWPGQDPLGKCMIVGSDAAPCSTVVGVARDARRESLTDDAPVLQYYVPLAQGQVTVGLRVLFVRTRGDPEAALEAVRRQVQSVSPDLPYPTVQYLARQIEAEIRPWKLGATLFGLFGVLALALAALGLYSVVAYSVAQRRHEMGVRVALGARGADVAGLVLRETLVVIGLGLGIGLAAAVAAGGLVEPMLFQVSARDPGVIAVVVGTLLLVAVCASLVPARRAARVSPAEVLKAE